MAKNLIEFNAYDADIVAYSGYNSNKTILGPQIYRFTGSSQSDYYIGPPQTSFRDITQDTGLSNWGDIDAITYRGDTQWLFCLKGIITTVATTDIAMYEFDRVNSSYTYKGEIRCSGADVTSRTQQGIKANLDYYTGGTVEVFGVSVTGTGTNWIERRIPIGARIGFGSTNPDDITTWYRITNYPLMNSQPTKVNSNVNCVTVDPSSGKIYIAGNFTTYDGIIANRIARLNTDGTLDTSFNPNLGFNANVYVITLDSSGKLYVGGDFTTYDGVAANRIIKLNTDGTKDVSFDNTTGFNTTVNDIKLDSLGQIWVGGNFTTYKGVSAPYLTKLNTDGSRDGTYPNTTNPNTTVLTITIDNNDDVYIGGNFTQVGATANNSRYIAKILKTGGLDPTFVVGTGTGGGFNAQAYSIIYKPLTNSIIVGGTFTSWKSISNAYLIELSSIGNIVISTSSPYVVQSMIKDSIGNVYVYALGQVITKRNINTLLTDPTFTPNIIYTTYAAAYSDRAFALNPTEDRLYVVSSNNTVDSGVVCVEVTGGTRDVNFLTTPDYKSQVITINGFVGTLPPGTPYVIEDLKIFVIRSVTGTHMIQGISIDDFTISPTTIPAPSFNFMGLDKGRYNIQDGAYFISSGFQAGSVNSAVSKDLRVLEKENDSTQYLYVVSNVGRISRFNIKSPYITQLGTNTIGILRYNTSDELLVTGNGVITPSGLGIGGLATGKFTIGTMQSGSANGVKSIFLDNSGVVQTSINDLANETSPLYTYMPEIPPGSTLTYNAAGNVGRVYFMPTIDKLVILNSSATAKSYVTKYQLNMIQPTLSNTFYTRDTFSELSSENSYDIAFLMNGNQLQGNTANVNAPRYPDTLGTGFFGTVENGILHLCRPLITIQNNLYSVPLGCESEYVDFSNNVIITPKFILPNVIGINGLYINQMKEYGAASFVIPPEVIVIHYRTTGIDTNTGEWTEFVDVKTLNDEIICKGVLETITIQFRFSFKIAGNTCIPNKLYGFSLLYEDNRTDSHYSPSVSNSSLSNRTFAWRQETLWYGTIPNLKIRLYNATNNNIVFYDEIATSASGTWQYSVDNGSSWLPWDSSADNIGNYIRYVADFIPSGIKLRVGLNTL